MKTVTELLQKIFDAPPAILFLLIGFVLIFLGLTGGFNIKGVDVPITPSFQIIAIVVGVALLVASISFAWSRPTNPRPYGIRITHPSEGGTVTGRTDVRGDIRRLPSSAYELWLLRIYDNGDWIPLRRISPLPGQQNWSLANIDAIGGGEYAHTIAVCLVPLQARPLFDYFDDAAKVHNDLANRFKAEPKEPNRYLPAVKSEAMQQMDIAICDRVVNLSRG
jgi:hypothetical protein